MKMNANRCECDKSFGNNDLTIIRRIYKKIALPKNIQETRETFFQTQFTKQRQKLKRRYVKLNINARNYVYN